VTRYALVTSTTPLRVALDPDDTTGVPATATRGAGPISPGDTAVVDLINRDVVVYGAIDL